MKPPSEMTDPIESSDARRDKSAEQAWSEGMVSKAEMRAKIRQIVTTKHDWRLGHIVRICGVLAGRMTERRHAHNRRRMTIRRMYRALGVEK